MVLGIIGLIASLLIIPFFLGLLTMETSESVFVTVVRGLITEWAVLAVIAIPCIIKETTLTLVIVLTAASCLLLSVVGIIRLIILRRKSDIKLFLIKKQLLSKNEILFLALFIGVVLFQLYKTLFYAYEDGDDAYYISIAASAASSDTMYRLDAYMGVPTSINFRYALAPFPIWISCLTRISGLNTAFIAHTLLPAFLLLVTYVIYIEISKLLFKEKEKQYMLLTLLSVFFMFENVSTSTQGTFLLTRARQGKEALADIILPFLFLMILKLIKNDLKFKAEDWLMLLITLTAAALTSVLGNILAPLMILFLFIYTIIKKKFKLLPGMAALVIPNACMCLVYWLL